MLIRATQSKCMAVRAGLQMGDWYSDIPLPTEGMQSVLFFFLEPARWEEGHAHSHSFRRSLASQLPAHAVFSRDAFQSIMCR